MRGAGPRAARRRAPSLAAGGTSSDAGDDRLDLPQPASSGSPGTVRRSIVAVARSREHERGGAAVHHRRQKRAVARVRVRARAASSVAGLDGASSRPRCVTALTPSCGRDECAARPRSSTSITEKPRWATASSSHVGSPTMQASGRRSAQLVEHGGRAEAAVLLVGDQREQDVAVGPARPRARPPRPSPPCRPSCRTCRGRTCGRPRCAA